MSPVQAREIRASFDCSEARGTVETAICKDAELAALDRAVDQAYRSALRRIGDATARKALLEEQRSYLNDRDEAHKQPDYGGLGAFMEQP
jgi:uncharacterized protein